MKFGRRLVGKLNDHVTDCDANIYATTFLWISMGRLFKRLDWGNGKHSENILVRLGGNVAELTDIYFLYLSTGVVHVSLEFWTHRLRETSAIRTGITGVAISFQMAEEGGCYHTR